MEREGSGRVDTNDRYQGVPNLWHVRLTQNRFCVMYDHPKPMTTGKETSAGDGIGSGDGTGHAGSSGCEAASKAIRQGGASRDSDGEGTPLPERRGDVLQRGDGPDPRVPEVRDPVGGGPQQGRRGAARVRFRLQFNRRGAIYLRRYARLRGHVGRTNPEVMSFGLGEGV